MHKRRAWLVELLRWIEKHPGRAEEIADYILEVLEGGDATTPDQTPPDT